MVGYRYRLQAELLPDQFGNSVDLLWAGDLEGNPVNRGVLTLEVVGRNIIHGTVVVAVQGGNVIDRDVSLHTVPNSIHDLVGRADGAGLLKLGDDTRQDLLLPFLPAVIVVRVLIAHPGILQCLFPIQVLLALLEVVPLVSEGKRVINFDAAEGVNDLLEDAHVDDRVVVDWHIKQFTDLLNGLLRAADGISSVNLDVISAIIGVDPDQGIPGDTGHRDPLRFGVDGE